MPARWRAGLRGPREAPLTPTGPAWAPCQQRGRPRRPLRGARGIEAAASQCVRIGPISSIFVAGLLLLLYAPRCKCGVDVC